MIKEELVEYVTSFFNEENEAEFNLEIDALNSVELFHYHTVKRLHKAYKLFLANDDYLGDFLIAFRDYMITLDVAQEYKGKPIKETIKYGVDYDDVEGKYFASMQLPKYVNEKFISDAFIKNTESKKIGKGNALLTDSLIYSLTGYSHFKSMDQKLAVYGALNAPEGYTVLVSLPTGGGKSLVTQTISYQKDGLTIVIVPTISLAIDQKRVTKKVIKRATNEEEIFSYSSGDDVGPIFKAIREQKAKVLFISPEALLENPGFAEVVKEANKSRYLKNIVIDEAHIVVDWGASFRVDYQCLESWRNMLLLTNPSLRTILLSATFEDRCVATLRNFFEVNEKWIEVRCDALRHEPRYTVIRAKSYAEKQKNILELVRKLPHPMIIYVARPVEADQIKQMLAFNGIKNTRTFTGLTGRVQREKLIDAWVDDDYEIMIATSAFGVGVDKGDVRTVIHTYIPQNANTYYQELGRGGRDRLPCLSVMCLQPEDTTIGRDRIKKRVLTPEKIIGRWDSLYNNAKSQRISNNRVFIDTSIKPNYADVDEFDDSPTSDADMNWNVYVLLFLRRFIIKSTHNRRERPVHGHRGGSRGRFYYRITTFEGRPWDARDPYKTTFMALKHEIRLSIWRKQKETPGVEKAPGVSSPQRKESGRSGRDDGELRFWVRPGHPYKAVTSISQAEALAHGLTHLHHLVFAAVLARELDWCAALQDAREDARPWGVVGIGLRSDVWVEVRRDDHRPAVLVT